MKRLSLLAGFCLFALLVVLGVHRGEPATAIKSDVSSAGSSASSAVLSGAGPLSASATERQATLSARHHIVEDPRCITRSAPDSAASDADGPQEAATAPDASVVAAREHIMNALRTSSDPYANAVAVWLDVQEDRDRDAGRYRQLEAMAVSAQDPRLYELALRTCWKTSTHECQSLTARRWSELEPTNALPWLMMMDEARRDRDASGLQDALYHAAHAPQLAERAQAPLQAIVDAASDDPASLVAARSLALDAIGLAEAQAFPDSLTECRKADRSDGNLWQECTALVGLLENRSDSILTRVIGAGTDRRLTGNEGPAKIAADQQQQLLHLDPVSSSSCSDLREKLLLMRRLAVEGEASVLRAGRSGGPSIQPDSGYRQRQ